MAENNAPENLKELPIAIVAQMITLSTSGFGVVVALAWNEAIKAFIESYVKPYLGKGSGIISLLIYAIGVTVLAVIVTMQLSIAHKKLENIREKVKPKKQEK